MHRTLRTPRRLPTFRPRLEKLEERSQPGSLLTEFAGWSLLGPSFAVLPLGETAERTAPVTRYETAVPAAQLIHPVAGGSEREEREQTSRGVLVAPPVTDPSEAEALLSAAAVEARPLDGGGEVGVNKFDGTWYPLASMPTPRQEVATSVLNGEIYVIGGFNTAGQATNVVEVYNPNTDTWRRAAPLPIVNDHGAAATVLGGIIAFGGQSNRTFVYLAEGDFWFELASMRYQHGGTPAVGVLYDDYIIVAGGTGGGMTGNEVELFDPYNNVWIELARMGVPRNHTAGGVIDNQFYVAAGRGSAGSATAFEVYDPTQNTWTRLPNLPTGRSGVAAGVVYGCLYVIGGEMPGVFSEVEVYDPGAGAWSAATPMLTPRHGIYASVIDNAIYIPGGAIQQGFGATGINEVFVVG